MLRFGSIWGISSCLPTLLYCFQVQMTLLSNGNVGIRSTHALRLRRAGKRWIDVVIGARRAQVR